MRLKNNFYKFFLVVLAIITCHASISASDQSSSINDDFGHYTQALASLVFHVQELQEELNGNEEFLSDKIPFTEDKISSLWDRSIAFLESAEEVLSSDALKHASENYYRTLELKQLGLSTDALQTLDRCCDVVTKLWEEAISQEEAIVPVADLFRSTLRHKDRGDPNLEKNPYLPKEAKKKMRPFLLSFRHPMRSFLDSLCLKKRITSDKQTFEEAGFHVFSTRPRSYISVASHPKMPGYLVKVYFDTVLEEKYDKPSWKWLVLRCEGALKIQNVIKQKDIKHFTVAKKWIYCLPAHPSPPRDILHKRHYALLLVTDMDLAPDDVNYYAWKHYITQEHLDELYLIISRAKGSSYRPDNIAYSNKGNFAFIDTEYPAKGPDFRSIRGFLNQEMKAYWDRIVINGGG